MQVYPSISSTFNIHFKMSEVEKDQTLGSVQESLPSEKHSTSSIEDAEPVAHLHAKTYLTVFAVCLIYFAQLINVVGAGAVSQPFILSNLTDRLARSRYWNRTRRLWKICLARFFCFHPHCRSQSSSLPSRRLLGQKMVSSRTHGMRCYWIYHCCTSNFDEHGYCR